MAKMPDIAVEVTDLAKSYGFVVALKSVNFRIESGRYFVLLGPSGGGKTTLLRLIGGFIRPTRGRVLLHGRDVSDLPPNKRPTSMVFQSFALFPHMVGLTGLGDRMPHELSGGQQQRVQLARSLVLETDILLLDEPLASLDAKLHKIMCIELKRLQEKVGITFIHVTHNQEEAMTVADDLAIIASGELVEAGKAIDLYENPVRRFTAGFIGENNIFDGRVTRIDGAEVTIDLGYGALTAHSRGQPVRVGDDASVSVRSERLRIFDADGADENSFQCLSATYLETVYLV